MILLADDDLEMNKLLGETIGFAIIDSGCTKTVCGDQWLNLYLESLSREDRKSVISKPSTNNFRFGVGKIFPSNRAVLIPVHIGSVSATLETNVVSCNIPLLISRVSLKKANSSLDFMNDSLEIFDQKVPLHLSESGHYCINLSRPLDQPFSPLTQNILFTTPFNHKEDPEHCKRKIEKLHKQFGHPRADKLKKLLTQAGSTEKEVLNMVDTITQKCETCCRFKKAPLRPSVGFPLASTFNETVAMDLKVFTSGHMLHMIDHATRYSQSCFITNKRKETIVKAMMKHWLSLFGSPKYFLTDNGGEFVNDEFNELAEKFNISVRTTAAESPWSNGLIEKHNGIIGDMIHKTLYETGCDLEMAIHWCTSAHNSLTNVYGFSPNQLVFGHNPSLPTVHSDRPPAQNQQTSSQLIYENLRALHTAREAFMQQEACEKLRRALNRKVRPSSFFSNGEQVYYKRNDSHMWHGPATVLGKDAQNYLLKHGGIYVRVHPCRLQRTEDTTDPPDQSQNHDTNHQHKERHTKSQSQPEDLTSDDENPSAPSTPGSPTLTQEEDPQPINSTHDPIPHAMRRLLPHNESPTRPAQEGVVSRLRSRTTAPAQNQPEEVLFGENMYRATDDIKFKEAKEIELQRWVDMEVFEETPDTGQQPRVTSRWVLTEKLKGGEIVCKARLVARGFQETNNEIETDSPTCQKDSLRLILCIITANKWQINSMDIKCAFLQGLPLERELYLVPPKDINIKGTAIWRLKKCPYGLADAGRKWYLKLTSILLSLDGKQSTLDQALFSWYNSDGTCIGLMAIHVDDIIYGGDNSFQNHIIQPLRDKLEIGLEESNGMKYIGLDIHQTSSYTSISNNPYTSSLQEIKSLGSYKERELSTNEKSQMRQISGQLNWITTQSRPDLSYDNCIIANSVKSACVKDAIKANKTIRKARQNDVHIRYSASFDTNSCKIIGYTDSSFGNLPDGGSQGAFVIFLIDGQGLASLLSWQSRRIRRVANSSLSAECIAGVECMEACVYTQTLLCDLIARDTKDIPISILTDNKSLVDSSHSTVPTSNKRLRIEIGIIREMLRKGEIEELRWIPDKLNLANALTKDGASAAYLQVINGELCLNEAQITSGSSNSRFSYH